MLQDMDKVTPSHVVIPLRWKLKCTLLESLFIISSLTFNTVLSSEVIERNLSVVYNQSESLMREVLKFISFESNLENTCNIILMGGNERTTAEAVQHCFSVTKSATVIPYAVASAEIEAAFQNITAQCSQSRSVFKCVVVIQPRSLEQTRHILLNISSYYKYNPSQSPIIYFFIAWPENKYTSSNGTEFGVSSFNSDILNVLEASVKDTPLDSHLYIARMSIKQSGLLIEVDETGERMWTIWEFYSINRKNIFQPIAMHSMSTGKMHHNVKSRADFKGASIRVLAQKESVPNSMIEIETINGTDVFKGGKILDIMGTLSFELNARLEIVFGKGWITLEPDENIRGMGTQLLNNEADFTLSFNELLPSRIKHLASSHPVMKFPIKAYFKPPPPGLYRNIFLEAFSTPLWIVVAATWALILTFLIVFGLIKRRYSKCNSFSESDEISLQESVSWALGIACQQGLSYFPASVSMQIIAICGLFASLVYYTAFSASIISIFSVELHRFNKLSDLEDHGFKLYGSQSSFTGLYDVEGQAKKDGVPVNSRIINETTVLQKMQTSRSVFISSEYLVFVNTKNLNISSELFCKYLSTISVSNQYLVWYFRKFDGLKKFVDLHVSRVRENGVGYRWIVDHHRTLPPPCEPKRKEPLALEFEDVQTAFYVLIFGFISSFFILVYEFISFCRSIAETSSEGNSESYQRPNTATKATQTDMY